jgi:hypothetical protein
VASDLPLTFSRHRLARGAGRTDTSAERTKIMDMRKYATEHFVNIDDVRDDPIEDQIAVVKDGKYDKPNIVLESGDVLSLNATNRKTLVRAYGNESDLWIGKTIRLLLGTIEYQGADHEAVLVEPISPPIKKKETKKKETEDADALAKPKLGDMDDEIPF